LAEHKDLVRRVGNDRELGIARQAEKMGAIDQVMLNLPSLARQADLVVLAVPVDEVRETLKVIAPDLREGAVVVDTSPTQAGLSWSAEILPPNRHFIGWKPALNPAYLDLSSTGVEAARADLFKNSLVFITSSPGADPQAVKLASDLTTLLGAKPLFADPDEMEGLIAISLLLPQLAAAALLNTALSQPGWNEARKLAGQPFAEASAPVTSLDEMKHLGQAALLNHQNATRLLDNLIGALGDLRTAIARQDADRLHALLSTAREGRQEWLGQRRASQWRGEESKMVDLPTSGQVIGRLFGLGKKPGTPKDR
jgi:prephenate dehydrogenase